MKKTILVFMLAITMGVSAVAQKFEVIWEHAFDDFFEYYEEWPDDIGYGQPGIGEIFNKRGENYIFNDANGYWIRANDVTNRKESYGFIYGEKNGILFLKFKDGLHLYIESQEIGKPDYVLKVEGTEKYKGWPSSQAIYFTEGMVFAQTNNDKLMSWKLLGNGKSEYYNAEKTQEMLDSGLAEKLGYSEFYGSIYFGENCVTRDTAPYVKVTSTMTILDEKYKELPIRKYIKGFIYLGTDKNGLSYFYYLNDPTQVTGLAERSGEALVVNIVCADNFEKTFQTVATLPAGDWDPSRNAGGLIARCSQCIDEEGNVYFTDCSKEKGVYQIKKLTNTWSKELGYSERKIGKMTANRIPLYEKKDTSSENNGYNYEHEYLWVLKSGEKWSKVRKVDGREGYVETRYIRFN